MYRKASNALAFRLSLLLIIATQAAMSQPQTQAAARTSGHIEVASIKLS
jgi:hypothetical protein